MKPGLLKLDDLSDDALQHLLQLAGELDKANLLLLQNAYLEWALTSP